MLRKSASLLVLALSLLATLSTFPGRVENIPRQVMNAGPIGTTDYPWTMFHYDQFRDGATPAAGPSSPSLMWTYPTGDVVYPSPVVADGYVFIPSYDGTLYAIDEYTGSLIWSFPTGGNIFGSPAVANGIVYVPSKNGYMYALNEATGSVVWKLPSVNLAPITSSPVIANSTLFYGTFFGGSYAAVFAVDAQTGSKVWEYDLTSFTVNVNGAASVSNGRVFIGGGLPSNGYIFALNETGNSGTGTTKLLWSYNTGVTTSVSTAPVAAYGNVYVGLDSTKFIALNQATGGLVWSFNTPGGSNATTPVVYNGVVYFGTGAGIVYALNATTGSPIWRYPTAGTIGAVASSPALALGSNTLYFGSNNRYLYALNMATGALQWRFLTGGQISSSPAVANNRVFFGAKDHKVYALGATIPPLYDTITSSPSVLEPGQNATLTITVRNSTAPESNANLTLTTSAGGTISQPILTGPGTFQSNFTAPIVSSTTLTTIQVTASSTGYVNAVNQISITVNPFPTLKVEVSPRPTSITPGGEITLMIKVTNGTVLVSGASLQLSSSAGGTFSPVTDFGNGNYSTIFTTPLQASDPVVTARASKSEFTSGQGQTTVTVNGVPNLTTLKVSGIPFFYLVAGGVVLFLLVLAALVRKKKSDYPYYAPARSGFSY